MSVEDDPKDEVAERIEAVQKSLPPKPGVRSRLGHASVDHFAEMLGTDRQRVISWTRHGREPEPRYRERLSELSGGRFEPDDFRRPEQDRAAMRRLVRETVVGVLQEIQFPRLAELEALIADGAEKNIEQLKRLSAAIDLLSGAVDRLGQQSPPATAPQRRRR